MNLRMHLRGSEEKNFLKVRIIFFFKSSLNREWYVCDIFFLSRKKWKRIHNHIYFITQVFKAWISAADLYSIVIFIFAQIWNNYRVGTGYINRQIFTIHIFLHFILAYFYEDKELFFLNLKHTCTNICCLFFCDCSKE